MCALVIVGGIDSRTDECHCHITARLPERLTVRGIEPVDISLIGNAMLFGESTQLLGEARMVDAAGILDAQRRVEFIRLLPGANDRHVHREQLGYLGWNPCRGAMTDLFII